MSKTTSISTVYIDPPQYTTNPRKLDIRVDDVVLYGAKEVRPTKRSKRKPIRLEDVVEDFMGDGLIPKVTSRPYKL